MLSEKIIFLEENKKRIACDQIFPEKVVHKNVNNIVIKQSFSLMNIIAIFVK